MKNLIITTIVTLVILGCSKEMAEKSFKSDSQIQKEVDLAMTKPLDDLEMTQMVNNYVNFLGGNRKFTESIEVVTALRTFELVLNSKYARRKEGEKMINPHRTVYQLKVSTVTHKNGEEIIDPEDLYEKVKQVDTFIKSISIKPGRKLALIDAEFAKVENGFYVFDITITDAEPNEVPDLGNAGFYEDLINSYDWKWGRYATVGTSDGRCGSSGALSTEYSQYNGVRLISQILENYIVSMGEARRPCVVSGPLGSLQHPPEFMYYDTKIVIVRPSTAPQYYYSVNNPSGFFLRGQSNLASKCASPSELNKIYAGCKRILEDNGIVPNREYYDQDWRPAVDNIILNVVSPGGQPSSDYHSFEAVVGKRTCVAGIIYDNDILQ